MTRQMSQPSLISINNNPKRVCNSNHTLSIAIQSLVNRTATFGAFINNHNPDIIIVSETSAETNSNFRHSNIWSPKRMNVD